jgi:hypothetical protein
MKPFLLAAVALAALAAGAGPSAAAPASVTASYNLFRDGLHIATVDESFERSGDKYQIVSASNPAGALKRLFRTQIRIQSNGAVTPSGLRPHSFDYGRLDDASKNVNAEFDWGAEQLRMSYEGRKETAQLLPGTQDRLSLMYQFMFMPLAKLKVVTFPMTNGRKIDSYRYEVAGAAPIDTPLGKMNTLHLVRQREAGDNTVEVWLAAERNFIPVKVLIVESDGAKFEQVITRLEFK